MKISKDLRKNIGKGYCPSCCDYHRSEIVREVMRQEDAKGNTYCGKCGGMLGIKIIKRTKKEQEKWLKEESQ